MKYLSVVGTRPQLVKLSAVDDAFTMAGLQHEYIDTGQHYDAALAQEIKQDLGTKPAIINLRIGSHTHAVQTAKIMEALDSEIDRLKPETVLVYGDTNSTIAATLVAVKKGIRVAHIEAGLRSFNRSMPEEINRVATDHLSDLLFCPTETAIRNLEVEGLSSKSELVGDVMCDLLLRDAERFVPINRTKWNLSEHFIVSTIHRAENTDSRERLSEIVKALSELSIEVVLFAHPRLRVRLKEFDLAFGSNVKMMEPAPHSELLSWAISSQGIVTDSGGFQKEAFILGVPCTTIRAETEWTETLENGWNVLVPDVGNLNQRLNTDRSKPRSKPFGDGKAAEKIVKSLGS